MALELFNLNNKNALITGAAGVLGKEHASALLEVGSRVVITDICSESLESTKKDLAKSFDETLIETQVMDVTNEENIKLINDFYVSNHKKIDILINNAAIDPKVDFGNGIKDSSRLENFELSDWNLQINVGLTGAFLCSKIFGATMAKNNGGIILNIASDLSVISPDQRLYKKPNKDEESQPVKPITYSVIKTGLIGMTRYLSTYWIDKGVRCNSLSPGGIYTSQDKEFLSKIKNLIPMGRMAKKDEYRSTIQYLCSDASSYMNGQNIVVDGGRSVW